MRDCTNLDVKLKHEQNRIQSCAHFQITYYIHANLLLTNFFSLSFPPLPRKRVLSLYYVSLKHILFYFTIYTLCTSKQSYTYGMF